MAIRSSKRFSTRLPYRRNASARNNSANSGIEKNLTICIAIVICIFIAIWLSQDNQSSWLDIDLRPCGALVVIIAIVVLVVGFIGFDQASGVTVTEIVEDFNNFLRAKGINPYFGKQGIFQLKETCESLALGLKDKAPNNKEQGNLLQFLIYKYLIAKQGFKVEGHFNTYPFYDPTYGEAAWTMAGPMVTVTGRTKVLEAKLSSYDARGRADFYTCGGEGPSILIDFKWTSKDWTDPPPWYALQLLLYQWLAGRRFEEERGAKMYLIRFVEKSTELQLISFNPPEHMQYSKASAGVDNYKDIVRLFLLEYYPELFKDSD